MLGFVTGVGRITQEICSWNGYGVMLNKGFYPQCLLIVIAGVYGGIGACGKHRNKRGGR